MLLKTKYSQDGNWIALTDIKNNIVLCKNPESEIVCNYIKAHDKIINDIDFSSDSKYLSSSSADKTVKIWDT